MHYVVTLHSVLFRVIYFVLQDLPEDVRNVLRQCLTVNTEDR